MEFTYDGDGSAESTFTGKVEWVQIDVDDAAEDPDHLISPEERSGWRWRSSSRGSF